MFQFKKSSTGNSIKVKMPDGSERIISLDPGSELFKILEILIIKLDLLV